MEQLKVRAVSIAVVRDGKLDWARAYGYADREWKIRATPDTLFQPLDQQAAYGPSKPYEARCRYSRLGPQRQ